MPKIIHSCWDCEFHDRDALTGTWKCFKTSTPLNPQGQIPPDCPLEDAPDVEKLQAENKFLRDALSEIMDTFAEKKL